MLLINLFPCEKKNPSATVIEGIAVGNYLGSARPVLAFVEGLSGIETTLLFGDSVWCLGGGQKWEGQANMGDGNLEVITLYGFK